MPIGGNKAESNKKVANKRRNIKQISKPKQSNIGKTETKTSTKVVLKANEVDFGALTPSNFLSLRWDNVLEDAQLENDRIEQYKELRRQRYNQARQQAIETLIATMKKPNGNGSKKPNNDPRR